MDYVFPDVSRIHESVLWWFDQHGRDLPMRSPSVSAWGTLVFEVMSQQTPIPRVQPVWMAWMQTWPTPDDLALATPADVLVAWDRLGYPSRALRLRECAQAIVDRWGGQVPDEESELLTLPGIGPYTASAVLAFHFRQRVVVLDTNIRRVFARVFGGVEHQGSGAASRAEMDRAWQLLPADDAESAVWNVAVMELGALVCSARSPQCDRCPLIDVCQWRDAGFPALPGKKRVQAWAGTDRQARGRVMALLRARHEASVGASAGKAGESVAHSGFSHGRRGLLAVREGIGWATREEVLAAATLPGADSDQAARVVEALLADKLIVSVGSDIFRLP